MNKPSRRTFIKWSFLSSLSGLVSNSANALTPTPAETAGPFYPIQAQKDKDFDLTRIAGKNESAKGNKIVILGQVKDTDGNTIEDATVDIWQANAAGRYAHPHDTNSAPLDPAFQGWAIVQSGKEGKFQFKTIYPGAYPVSRTRTRTPHIHFKVSKRGYVELVTQMYFPGERLNHSDLLLNRKSELERNLMIASKSTKMSEGNWDTYVYSLVLEKT
ncbi:protocatechuate 3,4-dioxygenase [Aliikangiella coralliicola]|uniref:Protocatechuate 3,4-dioxygenase n=1 Tax=Aliikangiella coralliicola TaxID=2592383 RepID=A0A545UCJ7_9GAMM|nr:protocatechuate 3,4-dioxygenase [Aliikangiella coralliicola]TQV87187.1 protocatechuate 3,4-dioxygenase [Aliikangiella coralliicola]